ncbi:CDP-glycerol glycerophosphotransferase family protein [Streptomyces microflavus]
MLEAGSPANDVLFPPDRDKAAEEVRRTLGIPEDHRVVLYAPTYRDHLAHPVRLPDPSDRTAPGPYRWDPASTRTPSRARSAPATRCWSGSTPGSPAGSRTGPACSTSRTTRARPDCS